MNRLLVVCFVALSAVTSGAVMAQHAGVMAQRFPDVIDARVHALGDNRFDFDATIASPYDTPQRYADAFRVMSPDGKQFGERTLFHDHANEQPFTRDLYGITIPVGIQTVVIQARDKRYGYGGKTIHITLPGR
tara:strand:- start:150 stop:548 length:399 start_codon:yes stop_codon:yes gene_type:complete